MHVNKDIMRDKDKLKKYMIQLLADQIHDKMTKLFNDMRKRLGINGDANIEEPAINYNDFNQDNNGNLKIKLWVWGISTRV